MTLTIQLLFILFAVVPFCAGVVIVCFYYGVRRKVKHRDITDKIYD